MAGLRSSDSWPGLADSTTCTHVSLLSPQQTSPITHVSLLSPRQTSPITVHPFLLSPYSILDSSQPRAPGSPYQSIRVGIWNETHLSFYLWALRNHQRVFRPDYHG